MKVLIIGNGISGLFAAKKLADKDIDVVLVSADMPQRSQSVMAAGGINAAIDTMGEKDTILLHTEETIKSGRNIDNKDMIESLCNDAPEIIKELSNMGVLFTRAENGTLLCRSFGGQSKKRTVFAGASTGKQIVTTLSTNIRKYEKSGKIQHLFRRRFLKAMIHNGTCFGAYILNEQNNTVETVFADAVIMATGGQNKLFGKTTGSTLCDGFAAAELLSQGVILRNLEFVQYHPTTIETPAKRMLISEAARGEGGRLFYVNDDGSRCYFMEEKYGEKGNLMPRDVVSKEMYDTGKDIFLDVTMLGKDTILKRIPEIYDLCSEYLNIDISKDVIPVAPSVHFFMGGISVSENHETNITNLFAIGECASAYHGANRLGGNSLLAALHSANVACDAISLRSYSDTSKGLIEIFNNEESELVSKISDNDKSESKFPAVYIMEEIAKIMKSNLGISRNEKNLLEGLKSLKFYENAVSKIHFDGTLSVYECYTLPYLIKLAQCVIEAALYRKESRGAHFREDFPLTSDSFSHSTYIKLVNGEILVGGEKF